MAAPSLWKALVMPQAMERSLATPKIRAFLPLIKPMDPALSWLVQGNYSAAGRVRQALLDQHPDPADDLRRGSGFVGVGQSLVNPEPVAGRHLRAPTSPAWTRKAQIAIARFIRRSGNS